MAQADQHVEEQVSADMDAIHARAAEPVARADDIDSHLAEFEAATGRPTAPAEHVDAERPSLDDLFAEPPATAESVDQILRQDAPFDPDAFRAANENALLRADFDQLHQYSAQLEQAVHHIQAREYWRQVDEVWNPLVAETAREFAKQFPDLPPDYVKKSMEIRAVRDPAFRQAFFNQHQNPGAWRIENQKMQRELHRELSFRPDPELTGDRMAVVAAMRGASGKVTAEPPPKLGQMSDAELRKYTRDNFGF